MSVSNKVTIIIDDQWLQEILAKMIPFVESDEIFQILSTEEVEVCSDCQQYLSSDKEVIMDVFKCPDNQYYCLNCCLCPEHEGEKWY